MLRHQPERGAAFAAIADMAVALEHVGYDPSTTSHTCSYLSTAPLLGCCLHAIFSLLRLPTCLPASHIPPIIRTVLVHIFHSHFLTFCWPALHRCGSAVFDANLPAIAVHIRESISGSPKQKVSGSWVEVGLWEMCGEVPGQAGKHQGGGDPLDR